MTARAEQSTLRARTCIGCGAQQQKTSLLRIVRTPEGPVFDPTGRANGRGAYVCDIACLERARKAKKLQRALKSDVSNEDYERLVRSMDGHASCVDER